MVLEGRGPVARALRLRDPQLHPVERPAVGRRRLLGVRHTPAGSHQVELARPDELLGPKAVVVQDLSGQQPRHRLQTHVRVGPDLHPAADRHVGGGGMVEEAPCADGSTHARRQRPVHDAVTHPSLATLDELHDRGARGRPIAIGEILAANRSAHDADPTGSRSDSSFGARDNIVAAASSSWISRPDSAASATNTVPTRNATWYPLRAPCASARGSVTPAFAAWMRLTSTVPSVATPSAAATCRCVE